MAKKIKKGVVPGDPEPVEESILLPTITSPYCSALVTIRVGPNQEIYHVQRDLFQSTKLINSIISDWNGTFIDMTSMDEGTVHVIVHYLYTNTYQTLDNINAHASDASKARVKFQRAVSAYLAARTYELPGLQQLVIEQIEQCGMQMSVSTIFDILNGGFQERTGWLHDYVMGKAKAAVEEDYASFTEGSLLESISNVELNRILVRCIADHCTMLLHQLNDRQYRMVSAETLSDITDCPPRKPPAEDIHTEIITWSDGMISVGVNAHGDMSRGETPVELIPGIDVPSVILDEPPSARDIPAEPTTKGSEFEFSFDAFNKPEQSSDPILVVAEKVVEPMIEEPPPPLEDFTFGAGTSTKKKKGKKGVATLIEETPPPPPPEPEPVPEPVKEEDSLGWGALAASGKKKKGKKGAVVETLPPPVEEPVPEPEPVLEPEPAPPLVDDGWGSFAAPAVVKKKKGKKGAIIEEPMIEEPLPPPVEPEPVPEPEPASPPVDDSWCSPATPAVVKKKKGKKGAIVEEPKIEEPKIEEPPPPPVEPETATEPEPALPPMDDSFWGSFAAPAVVKKKKGKKGAVVEEPIIEEPPPPVEPEPVTEPGLAPLPVDDGWGSLEALPITKKKKGKKGKEAIEELPLPPVELEPVPEPVPAPEPKPAPSPVDDDWGSFAAPAVVKKKKGKKGKKEDIIEEPPPPIELELVPELEQEPVVVLECEPDPEPVKIIKCKRCGAKMTKKKCQPCMRKRLEARKLLLESEPEPALEPALEPAPIVEEERYNAGWWNNIVTSVPEPRVEMKPEHVVEMKPEEMERCEEPIMELPATSSASLVTGTEYVTESESSLCPTRMGHILNGDAWKDCRQCRAFVRQVAIQLARMTHGDQDGYELVDKVLIE